MQVKSEYQNIIERVVGENKFFQGNEDLLDEFCAEVYRRTYLVLSTKDDEKELEDYIRIISNKVMQDVLRNNSREVLPEVRKDEEYVVDYVIDKNRYVENEEESAVERDEISQNPYRDYVFISDPLYSIDKRNIRHKMKRLAAAIYDIHMQMPEKLYFQIFYYKYCKGFEQIDVARKIGISQSELSRRLLSLIQILKAYNIDIE